MPNTKASVMAGAASTPNLSAWLPKLLAMAAVVCTLGTQADAAPRFGEGAWLHEVAESGVGDAQFEMGARYASGNGVPLDRVKAASWYRKAAEQGHPDAQNNLGRAYALGEGVTRNTARAVEWLSRAAEQGLAAAQSNLGAIYLNGSAGKTVAQTVVETYAQDPDRGDEEEVISLGATLPTDPGIEPDISLAVYWLTLAAQQGHSVAYDNLQLALDRLQGRQYANARGAPEAMATTTPEASSLNPATIVELSMSAGRHDAIAWEAAHGR